MMPMKKSRCQAFKGCSCSFPARPRLFAVPESRFPDRLRENPVPSSRKLARKVLIFRGLQLPLHGIKRRRADYPNVWAGLGCAAVLRSDRQLKR
jgi:hypothetical protein